MRFRPTGAQTKDESGYDAASYQHLGIDGYFPYPVVAPWEQVGEYRLPLASVSRQNDGGLRRHDGVEGLSSAPNVYMPQWSAPSNGRSVNLIGGTAVNPMNSFAAGQQQGNQFSANADQDAAIAQFINSQSPRFSMSSLSGE